MSPEEVAERFTALVGGPAEVTSGEVTGVVEPGAWASTVRTLRDDPQLALDYFDWLSAVDEQESGFDVVLHLYSTPARHRLLVRTRIPRDAPSVPTLVGVYPGAAWAERETHEMFGIDFPGHPDLRPLLLPDGFDGHPLRKDFVLASRVAKEWPGAPEPGEGAAPSRRRRRLRPPGVPDPAQWGPGAGGERG